MDMMMSVKEESPDDEKINGTVVGMNFSGDGQNETSKQLQVRVLCDDGAIRYGQLRARAPTAHWKAVVTMAMYSYESGVPITMELRPVQETHPDIVYIQLSNKV